MKHFHSIVWKEDDWYVAKTLEVEVASQGKSEQEALVNLKEALKLYFEEEIAMGTFHSILLQAGLQKEELEKYLR